MVARIAGSMMVCVAVLIVVSFLVSLGVLWLTGNVITSAAIGTIGGSAAAFAVDTLNTVVEGAGEQLSHENYRSGSSRTPPNSNCATNHSARQPSTPAIQGNVVPLYAPYSDLAPWHRASFSTSWTSCLASRASPISAKTADVILVPHCSYAQLPVSRGGIKERSPAGVSYVPGAGIQVGNGAGRRALVS